MAGYASNASLNPPADGFKYIQCAVSYGTWILQIQAETERALSKATTERRRARTELEGVKRALYGLLGMRDTEKRISDQERRRQVGRYQEEINSSLRKAAQAAAEAHNALTPPKLMLEEMESALPMQEANSVDPSYCQEAITRGTPPQHARHRKRAIALLKKARQHWHSVIELHRFIEQRVSRDLEQGEKPLLQHRINAFLKDERAPTHDFQVAIAPIIQRMLKVSSRRHAISSGTLESLSF